MQDGRTHSEGITIAVAAGVGRCGGAFMRRATRGLRSRMNAPGAERQKPGSVTFPQTAIRSLGTGTRTAHLRFVRALS